MLLMFWQLLKASLDCLWRPPVDPGPHFGNDWFRETAEALQRIQANVWLPSVWQWLHLALVLVWLWLQWSCMCMFCFSWVFNTSVAGFFVLFLDSEGRYVVENPSTPRTKLGKISFVFLFPKSDQVSNAFLYDTRNPVTSVLVFPKEGHETFFFRCKKPLWSRLSPAFNDVKPCLFRVCKSVSLSNEKTTQISERVNFCQHWGT